MKKIEVAKNVIAEKSDDVDNITNVFIPQVSVSDYTQTSQKTDSSIHTYSYNDYDIITHAMNENKDEIK